MYINKKEIKITITVVYEKKRTTKYKNTNRQK